MRKFYDTCALLNRQEDLLNSKEKIIISQITLKELEDIKNSTTKSPEVKFQARKLIHLLDEHEDKYELFLDCNDYVMPFLMDNNDATIIKQACTYEDNHHEKVMFVTDDLCCKRLAAAAGLRVEYSKKELDNYSGCTILKMNEEQLANFYENIKSITPDKSDLQINEYLLIQDEEGKIIDRYKCTLEGLVQVQFTSFDSKMFGKIKPKDAYQICAMDSLKNNQITMLRGKAGTGKSYLSFGYLFHKLEKGDIDKIIIFCNTVATSGSAKLGFYPGSKNEKLLDSQIGNLLASKIGDKIEVERLIDQNKIVLLPMSDIRGYDTTGMRAGVYISEAQNLDIELMRLALQRIGEDSFCILDGDFTHQVDMPIYAGDNNGMRRVSKVFRNRDFYGEVELETIYRSKIAEIAELM